MKKALIGYQIYSCREDAQKDLLGTLKKIKELGYDGVEFAGFYGHTAEEVKAMLDEVGLVAISDHVPFQLMEKDICETLASENPHFDPADLVRLNDNEATLGDEIAWTIEKTELQD